MLGNQHYSLLLPKSHRPEQDRQDPESITERKIVLAMALGYLAVVQIGCEPKAQVLLTKYQEHHNISLAPGCYLYRTLTSGLVAGLQPDCGSVLCFQHLWLNIVCNKVFRF
jgi:hypothetical protein